MGDWVIRLLLYALFSGLIGIERQLSAVEGVTEVSWKRKQDTV